MKTLTCKMKQLILQIETIFRSSTQEYENKYFPINIPIIQTQSRVLIEFKNWIDTLILRIVPMGSSYPYENRTDEITDIDYNNRNELYTFFTSFLDPHSLVVLDSFISTLIDTVYTWPSVFESIINSFYEETICNYSSKTKFRVNYPRLKLNSSLLFFEV